MRSSLMLPAAIALGSLFFATAAACGPRYVFTESGRSADAREPGCEFEVFTMAPEGQWDEIGTIDVSNSKQAMQKELAGFRDEIRSQVCKAGGDAIVAIANGDGVYTNATVLARRQAAPVAGCTFDTQCKGDRICRSGSCVDPGGTPASGRETEPTATGGDPE